MSNKLYHDELKIEAVKQVTERGYSVAVVASRLGTTTHSVYAWIKKMALKCLIDPGSQTLPISVPMKAGCIWQSLSISSHVE